MEPQRDLSVKEVKSIGREALFTSSLPLSDAKNEVSNINCESERVNNSFNYAPFLLIYFFTGIIAIELFNFTSKDITNITFIFGILFGLYFIAKGMIQDWQDYRRAGNLKKWLDIEYEDLREPQKKLGIVERVLEKYKKRNQLM